MLWNGRQKTSIMSPIYKHDILEFNPAYELIPQLNHVLSEATTLTHPQARIIWKELVDLINQWGWVQPGASSWLAGQILATILQSTWTWKAPTYLCARRVVSVMIGTCWFPDTYLTIRTSLAVARSSFRMK